jgi:phosphoribosylamine-glycine ligase
MSPRPSDTGGMSEYVRIVSSESFRDSRSLTVEKTVEMIIERDKLFNGLQSKGVILVNSNREAA